MYLHLHLNQGAGAKLALFPATRRGKERLLHVRTCTAIRVHLAWPYIIDVACLRNSVINTAIEHVHNGKVCLHGYRLVSVPDPTNPSALYGKQYTHWKKGLGSKTRYQRDTAKSNLLSATPSIHFGKTEAAYRHH